MKTLRSALLCLLFSVVWGAVNANDFEAALSTKTAQFTFRSDSSLIGWGGADLALGVFYNENSDIVAQASLLQMRQASQKNPLTLGVGVKAYAGQLDKANKDVLALGVGGELRYTIAGVMPMAFYLRGMYAPQITSFSDTDGVVDYEYGLQIEALPQTVAFAGLRHLQIKTSGPDVDVDDNHVHFGVRLTF